MMIFIAEIRMKNLSNKELTKENSSTSIDGELHKVVKSFVRKPVAWDVNCHMDNFIIQGVIERINEALKK